MTDCRGVRGRAAPPVLGARPSLIIGLWKSGGVEWHVVVLLKFHMPMVMTRVRSDNERGTSGESDADDVSAMTVWQDG